MAFPRLAAALPPLLLALTLSSPPATAQKIGTTIPEVHPKLETQICTTAGGCVTQQTKLVTDSLSRPFHDVNNMAVPCATMPLNATLCPDAATCAQNCVLEGVEYSSLGVMTKNSALTLRQYLFDGSAFSSVSPRLYLLAEDDMNYEPLKLLNQELSFDVDVSQLGCGMNGALYLSEMDMSGSRSELNPAGAQYGTGYCDAQCFTTPPFINGLANLNNSGSCCNEMDIWEANSQATVYTPHTCSGVGSFLCAGDECNKTVGVCDKDGCGINSFGLGAKEFYGPGLTIDTTRPFTVVTQFLTSDNTSTGDLVEIRRLYVQNGKIIPNTAETTNTAVQNLAGGFEGTITQDYCAARNAKDFTRLGGLKGMGGSLARGMVLIFSIWNSPGDFMSWLDGGNNGPCNATAGDPAQIVATQPDVSVTFSNIKWGDIGSTFKAEGPAGSAVASETVEKGVNNALAAQSGAGSERAMMAGSLTMSVVVGLAVLLGAFLS
ncbi:concanavalin A-like lectin/glucanase domain-containing protein [Apodospora peruviana]|uniref:Glucanase n=1 Tax=Apodospora peruviana TaxID=516989 RepID=A0AAE0I091_9PEZI|nr:concanavalin A-like lectin/glucanase domain-containing protein [Apodospora peruviana]